MQLAWAEEHKPGCSVNHRFFIPPVMNGDMNRAFMESASEKQDFYYTRKKILIKIPAYMKLKIKKRK